MFCRAFCSSSKNIKGVLSLEAHLYHRQVETEFNNALLKPETGRTENVTSRQKYIYYGTTHANSFRRCHTLCRETARLLSSPFADITMLLST